LLYGVVFVVVVDVAKFYYVVLLYTTGFLVSAISNEGDRDLLTMIGCVFKLTLSNLMVLLVFLR
jgi:hypothetical protein